MVGAGLTGFKNCQWQALIVLRAVFVGAPLEVRTEHSEATKGDHYFEARRARKCLIALQSIPCFARFVPQAELLQPLRRNAEEISAFRPIYQSNPA